MNSKKKIVELLKEFSSENSHLLPAIKKINEQLDFFSLEAAKLTADHFGVSLSRVFETASFYDEIIVKEKGLVEVGICDSLNCQNKGSDKIIQNLENFFRVKEGDSTGRLRIKRISCQGHCLSGPVMLVNGQVYEKVSPGFAIELVRDYLGMK